MTDNWSDLHQSFSRCLQRSDFMARFYAIFTAADPMIARTFHGTDWKHQMHALRHGVSASILYAGGGELGTDELERLYETHGKPGYDFPAWMYEAWLEALIQAIAETDPKYSLALGARWREAMAIAIARIRDGRDVRKVA